MISCFCSCWPCLQRLDGRCEGGPGGELRGRGRNVQKSRLHLRPARTRHAHVAQAHAALRPSLSENGTKTQLLRRGPKAPDLFKNLIASNSRASTSYVGEDLLKVKTSLTGLCQRTMPDNQIGYLNMNTLHFFMSLHQGKSETGYQLCSKAIWPSLLMTLHSDKKAYHVGRVNKQVK